MDMFYFYFEVIASHFDIINEYYLKLYLDITTNEIQLAKITASDYVLIIGSGSLPMTPILVAKETKAKVHTVDKDEKAVKNAQNYIKRFHLSDKISVSNEDACMMDMSAYDVIFILYGIHGLDKVCSAIARSVRSSTRIIYRVPPDSDDVLFTSHPFLDSFSIKDEKITPSIGGVVSLLLKRKKNNVAVKN
jgi:precorrin-6B methylase 2